VDDIGILTKIIEQPGGVAMAGWVLLGLVLKWWREDVREYNRALASLVSSHAEALSKLAASIEGSRDAD
jgi:hypothetical protein